MSEAPPLTDRELNAAFREGASDEDIEAVLRDLVFWSYVMRDPFGNVCASIKGREPTASKTPSNLQITTLSTISRSSRTSRTKPEPSMELGVSCFGRRS